MANFMPQLLYTWGKFLRYPLNKKLEKSQSWYGYFFRKENLLPLPSIKLWTIQHYTQYTIPNTNPNNFTSSESHHNSVCSDKTKDKGPIVQKYRHQE
jgi:hypothetical protein